MIWAVALYRVQIELNLDSGNERDKIINTWHCIADDVNELESGFVVQLTTFYGAIDGSLSKELDPSASWYRAYDLDDPTPRAPVLEENFNLGTVSTGVSAPNELAVVMSFEAPQQSGVAQARRRGRVYLGPWSQAQIGSNGEVHAALMSDLDTAMSNLLDASQAATTWAWAVYSRVNDAAIEVVHAWVDNAWDIQRRRGTSATSRVEAT